MAKKISSFNYDFFRIIRVVCDHHKPFTLSLGRNQAVYMRQQFHSFRAALRKEGNQDDIIKADQIMVRMVVDSDDPTQAALIFLRRDETEGAQILAKTLNAIEEEIGIDEIEMFDEPREEISPESQDSHENLLSDLGYGTKGETDEP